MRAGAFISTFVIAGLGAVASILLWQAMQRQQMGELERDASLMASTISRMVESRIEEQELEALRRWSWAEQPEIPTSEWGTRAELFLADHESFATLARVEGGRIVELVASYEGHEVFPSIEPRVAELIDQRKGSGRPGEASLGPIRLSDGRFALVIRIAGTSRGIGNQMTIAVFLPDVWLAKVLEWRASGFVVRVRCGNEDIFANEASDTDAYADGHWASESVRLSIGPDWAIRVHATKLLSEARSRSPMVALVAGLLISALIASLVHVSQLARMRAAAIASVNESLRDQIEATRRDEIEIRRLNEVLEVRVEERTAALRETVSELETFNYSVSHDLRSPLGAILNFAAILSQDYGDRLDAIARDYLQRIASSATSVVSLMDGLLAFSRSGREEIRKTRVDVRKLVEGLCDEQLHARGPDGCSFQIGELPLAYADLAMLHLVFANLISNACKFVHKGETPRVEIGGHVQGHSVVYFVRDEGIGFDMRFAEKLFGVFEQLHGSDAYEGHGVGLAIVARLVRRHGGRAWAEGALGKGATFYIELPLEGEAQRGPAVNDV